jgi:hypothetical protein
MDLCPDDVDETVVERAKPKTADRKALKDALKLLVKDKGGKSRRVASSDAWEECQRACPGVFTVPEFEEVCAELQADWDGKRAAKMAADGKVTP